MQNDILNIKNEAIAQISQAKDIKELERLKITYLGRNGKFNQLFKKIKDIDPSERKQFGITLNESKKTIENLLNDSRLQSLRSLTEKREWFDRFNPRYLE